MKKFKSIIIFVLALMCSVGCEDNPPIDLGSIVGTVTDGTIMEPLQGVSVSISPTGKTMTTGSDGKFGFLEIEDGQYTVSVSKENYNSDSKSINVQSGIATADFAITTGNGSIELSKSTLDFGTSDNTLVFDIENIGKSDLTYTVECSEYDWMSVSPKSGTIATTRIEPITITIDRSKIDESKSVTLPISSNAGSADILVKATHNVATGKLSVTPTSLDFGKTSSAKSFTVKNEGDADLAFELIGIEDWFSASCSTYTLAPDESTTVAVNVDRDKLTTSTTGSFTVASNGGSESIDLSVTIPLIAPELTVNVTEVDFGETSTTQTFTVYNTGSAEMTFNISESLNYLSTSYIATVAAGSSVVVTLTIDRDLIMGAVSDEISITSDGGSASLTVKAYEPINYGTVFPCDRDIEISVTSVETSGTTVYIAFKMTNNGSDTYGAFRVGQPLYDKMYIVDDSSNTYSFDNKNMSITVEGKTISYYLGYSNYEYVSNSFMGNGASLTGEIIVKNVDSSASKFTLINVGTYAYSRSGNQIDETSFKLYNVPIIR